MANEKRLIDANALRKEIDLCDIDTFADKQTICEQIADAPTVDAVEVVRCAKCKHCNDVFAIPPIADSLKLACMKGVNWRAVEPNHFCSYGERRTNDLP